MLAFFRRRKWIWVVLISIFSIALIVTLIPANLGPQVFVAGNVAEVGSEVVTAAEFQTAYHNYMDQIGADLTPEMLLAFGFDNQVIESLIDQYVMIAEARRLGLEVTPGEIQTAILSTDAFQENGAFIGLQRYRDLLVQNGLTVAEFEDSVRDQVLMGKLQAFLTEPMAVSLDEVELEYRYSNEQVVLDYFVIDPPALESQVGMTEEEMRAYYEANAARYVIPEKRRAEYLFVDTVRIRTDAELTEDEMRAYYDERIGDYRIEPRVSAQHILFRTQGKTPEEVAGIRELATDIAERAKAGEDFAELARGYSEDTSAEFGGDLGSFGPGQMVPQFETAAFALGAGATSDPVETEFGIHVIRVNEKQEERTQTFEEVEIGIDSILRFEKAIDIAAISAQAIAVALVSNSDTAAVAEEYEADVRETEFLARGDVYNGLSDTAALENLIFSLAVDEVGTAVEVANGHVIPILREIQESRPATYEEATEDVADDLRIEKAGELAVSTREEVEQLIADGASLEDAANAAGLSVLTSASLTRDGSIPEFGSTTELDSQGFTLEPGVTATPVTVAGRTIAFAVRERDELDEDAILTLLPVLRTELLNLRKSQFITAYATDVKQRMVRDGDIWRVDPERLAEVAEAAMIGHVH